MIQYNRIVIGRDRIQLRRNDEMGILRSAGAMIHYNTAFYNNKITSIITAEDSSDVLFIDGKYVMDRLEAVSYNDLKNEVNNIFNPYTISTSNSYFWLVYHYGGASEIGRPINWIAIGYAS